MKKLINIILGLVFLICSCNSKEVKTVDELVQQAQQSKRNGRYEEALNLVNKAVKLDSARSYLYVLRGEILSVLGRDHEGLIAFDRALVIDSENVKAWFNKGLSFSLLENYDSAILMYTKAISLKKTDGGIQFDLNSDVFDDPEMNTDIPMATIRYFRGRACYFSNKDSMALSDLTFSLNNDFEKGNSQLYIGIILLTHKKAEGCDYLRYALQNGEEEAQEYLSKYCK